MKKFITYNDVHHIVADTAAVIQQSSFDVDTIVAIGGGGYIPARMLRTFLKKPIKSVSLELYDDTVNKPTDTVKVKQWLDESDVNGKNLLVVDEVDDTRSTLHFCVEKLKQYNPASIAVFVVYNKQKPKRHAAHWDEKEAEKDNVTLDHYFPGKSIPDTWLVFPWDATDIDLHDRNASS